jgi:hypothetical protein
VIDHDTPDSEIGELIVAEAAIMKLEPVGDLLNQQAIDKLAAEGVHATYGNLHADVRPNAFGLKITENGTTLNTSMQARANATTTAFDYFNPLRWVGINDNTHKSADLADNDLNHVLTSGNAISYQSRFAPAGEYSRDYTYANVLDGHNTEMKMTCDVTQSSSSPDVAVESCKGFLYKDNQKIARVEQSLTNTSSRFLPSFSGLEDEDHRSKTVHTSLFQLDGRPIGSIDYLQAINAGVMDVNISTKPAAASLR